LAVNTYCAVLMDTVSIQKYVFASNTLRDNLGASHIVNQLFDDVAVASLANAFDIEEDKVKEIILHWQQEPGKMLLDDPAIPFEIGVAGGGKALLFFRDSDQAKVFIKTFTRDLLIKAPGLQLAVAINKEFIPDQDFSGGLKLLYEQLAQNRNQYFPETTLQSHGITAVYSETGTSLNLYSPSVEKYISIEKATKLEAADDEEEFLEEIIKVRHPSYCFSSRMDWLGQTEGNSYIAVVHIDGNSMGKWFQKSRDLEDYRHRSKNLKKVTEESFWSLVDEAVCIMPKLTRENGFDIREDKDRRKYLPIRPLILGGDDVTFVCEGRLGLYFTEKFLQIWTENANSQLSKHGKPENGEFSACAGVAIANTKYPFYRTYSFAQELCTSAKKSAREAKKGSWIDFHNISGTKSGNLDAIRRDEGVIWDLELYFGPYCLEADQEKSLQHLKNGIYEFSQWVRSDIKELRTAFYSGKEVLDTYLMDMAAKGNRLPYKKRIGVDYSDKGYVGMRTPYFDMLEMMEYYPLFLLGGGMKNETRN
jgi:hypothetical protein